MYLLMVLGVVLPGIALVGTRLLRNPDLALVLLGIAFARRSLTGTPRHSLWTKLDTPNLVLQTWYSKLRLVQTKFGVPRLDQTEFGVPSLEYQGVPRLVQTKFGVPRPDATDKTKKFTCLCCGPSRSAQQGYKS